MEAFMTLNDKSQKIKATLGFKASSKRLWVVDEEPKKSSKTSLEQD